MIDNDLLRNFSPLLLSQDHKPTREDESKRIREAGGFVINNRVMGELAVSRAFGDVDFKKGIQVRISLGEIWYRLKRVSQSIIEEEGGSMPVNNDGTNNNWDQPLIIAEPDVEVSQSRRSFDNLTCLVGAQYLGQGSVSAASLRWSVRCFLS